MTTLVKEQERVTAAAAADATHGSTGGSDAPVPGNRRERSYSSPPLPVAVLPPPSHDSGTHAPHPLAASVATFAAAPSATSSAGTTAGGASVVAQVGVDAGVLEEQSRSRASAARAALPGAVNDLEARMREFNDLGSRLPSVPDWWWRDPSPPVRAVFTCCLHHRGSACVLLLCCSC